MPTRRPRRTAPQVEQAIRDAVIDQLTESGYDSVSFEGIARRAGTSKPVLYRRFSDRPEMVLDALNFAVRNIPDPPASTTLRDDLVAWLARAYNRAGALGSQTYRGLVGEAADSTFQRIKEIYRFTALQMQEKVLEPARRRGELGPLAIDQDIAMVPLKLLENQVIFDVASPGVEYTVDEIAIPLFRSASGWEPRG